MAVAIETVTDMFAHRLKLHGEMVQVRAGTLHYFDDRSSAWFVVSGSVVLFAIQRAGGRQTGPRQYLATVSPGTVIWGMEQSPEADGIHLLAVAEADLHLVRLDVATFHMVESGEERSSVLSEGVDRWITALSQGVTRYLTPHRAVQRTMDVAEGDVALGEHGRIGGHKGVVWVSLVEGTGAYFDVARVTSGDGAPMLPLTPHSWLAAQENCVLRGTSTESLIATGSLPRHMDQLYQWLFSCLAYSFRSMVSMEDARLQARETRVIADTESTFVGLATLLNTDPVLAGRGVSANALFECCRVVGKAMGTTMVLPAGWGRQRRAEEQPVDIDDIAAASHLRVRMIVLRGQWWTEDNGPLIGYMEEDKRPVALLTRSGARYVLYDPVTGRQQKVTEKVARQLSVVAYTFYAGLPDRPVSGVDLLSFGLRRCWKDILVILAAGAAGGLIATSVPLATGYVFDALIPDHEARQLIQLALAMLVSAFSATVFHFVVDVAQLRVEGRVSGGLQAAFMDRLLRLPNSFFSDFSTGDLSQRIMVIEAIRRDVTGIVLGSIISGVFSVFSFALLFYYAPVAAAFSTVLILLMVAAAVVTGLTLGKSMSLRENLSGRVSGLVLGIITGISKIRLAAAEDRAFNLWGRLFRDMRHCEVTTRSAVIRYRVFWSGYEVLCLAAIYAIVGRMAVGTVSTGNFLGFVAAFTSFFAAMSGLAIATISILGVIPRYARAVPILRAVPEDTIGKADPGSLTGAFEINNIVFRYAPESPPVLNGLSIRVAAGEFIAVVGPSGSGKSTLMRLLLGFESAESGGVFYDGRDLRGLDVQSVRGQIGVVLQNGRLMPGTVYENIRGASHATLDECWDAAAQAGIEQDIRDMAMGMHTVLTEGASALSGGQVQRILIARAIVGKPRLLLMDEATSALDNETQAVVTESLDRLSVTRVVIAHRLSTVMRANRIYVVKQGRVVETGSYRELMSLNGVFAELARRQQI